MTGIVSVWTWRVLKHIKVSRYFVKAYNDLEFKNFNIFLVCNVLHLPEGAPHTGTRTLTLMFYLDCCNKLFICGRLYQWIDAYMCVCVCAWSMIANFSRFFSHSPVFFCQPSAHLPGSASSVLPAIPTMMLLSSLLLELSGPPPLSEG